MRTCIKCHEKNIYDNSRICVRCMKSWTDMRTSAWASLEPKLGKLSHANLPDYKKEMKRLEKIWRKDPDQFSLELSKLNKIS